MYTIKDALPDKRKTSVLNILENNLVTKDKCIVQFCIENVSLRRLKIYVLNIFYNTHNNYLPFSLRPQFSSINADVNEKIDNTHDYRIDQYRRCQTDSRQKSNIFSTPKSCEMSYVDYLDQSRACCRE